MADWSCGIPGDLLALIVRRLSLVDCISFGAVCESWRSVVAETGYPPSKLPWLLLRSTYADNSRDICRFYSLSDKKVYKIHIPGFRCSTCVGAAEGWLVIYRPKDQLMLLNPLTGSQIQLSSIPPTFYEGKSRYYDDQQMRAVMSWSSASSFTVLVHIRAYRALVFVRAGDKSWTRLSMSSLLADKLMHHKGLFYTHDTGGNVHVLDLNQPNPTYTRVAGNWRNPHCIDNTFCLVESSGDLFRLMRKFAWWSLETIGFEVLKLDPSGPKWTQVQTLGDHALFLGRYRSMSIPAHHLPGLKGSCIYFNSHSDNSNLRVFDLEDRSVKTYHAHDSYLNCSTPIWFVPNPF